MLYIATLKDGTIVGVGSGVRPVSTEEIDVGGPLASLPRFVPNPASNWHAWLDASAAEYGRRIFATVPPIDYEKLAGLVASKIVVPPAPPALPLPPLKVTTTSTVSPA